MMKKLVHSIRYLMNPTVYVSTVLVWIYAPLDMNPVLKYSGLFFLLLLFTIFMIVDLKKSSDSLLPEGGSTPPKVDATARLEGMLDREEFISDWEEFMAKREAKERRIENEFKPDQIDCYPVNIWDDFADGDDTYAYVEDRKIPSTLKFLVLNHLMQFAQTLDLVKDGLVKIRMEFDDSVLKYPLFVGDPECEFSLYRRWELKISCPNHEVLEELVGKLAKVPDFQGKKIDVYSES